MRTPLVAMLGPPALILGLLLAPACLDARLPAETNVTHAYAQVLRVTPVWGRVGGERRVVAYDVEYQYKGDVFMSRLDRDPGSRLRIRVSVTPVEDTGR